MVPVYSVDSLWKEILVFFTLHFEQPIQLELLAMQSFESTKEKGSVKLQSQSNKKTKAKCHSTGIHVISQLKQCGTAVK